MSDIIQTTTLRNNLSDTLRAVEKKDSRYLLIAGKKVLRAALVNLDFFEDLLALASPNYQRSIREARQQVKRRDVFTHTDVFGEL